MKFLKHVFEFTVSAINGFIDDNGFMYSASVSFYTLFSVAPVVLIMVYVSGFFIGNESALNELSRFLTEKIGSESSEAVMLLIDTIQTDSQNMFFLVVSVVFLMISATTVFVQFKDSFNRIFKVKPRADVELRKILIDRLIAFGMILLLGVAMITSLALDSILAGLSHLLLANFESAQLFMVSAGNNLLTLILIYLAVLTMFSFLPDVNIRRKPLLVGSFITTLLLVLGKFGVGVIIGSSSLNHLSGASSSIIILMLWVYYSSIIIFFGIELVKTLAEAWRGEIKAGRYARKLKLVEMPEQKEES